MRTRKTRRRRLTAPAGTKKNAIRRATSGTRTTRTRRSTGGRTDGFVVPVQGIKGGIRSAWHFGR